MPQYYYNPFNNGSNQGNAYNEQVQRMYERDNSNGAGMVMRLFTDAGNDGLRKDSEICLRRVV